MLERSPRTHMRGRWLWMAILACQGACALVWWWIMPGGLPWSHPRFFANQVLPLAVAATCVLWVYGTWSCLEGFARQAVSATLGFWTALWLAACALFRVSALVFAAPGFLVLAWLWLAFHRARPIRPDEHTWAWSRWAFPIAALCGVAWP